MKKKQLKHLDFLRLHEIDKILSIISTMAKENGERMSILEIGAGTGLQAKKMSEAGHAVEAIDIEDSGYYKNRVWPIKDYDGKNIPFSDNFFDIVFTSSVLEHIINVKEFQSEIKRVLKNDGFAIHILPNASWRLWTSITHYPFFFKELLIKLKRESINNKENNKFEISIYKKIKIIVFPSRHGEFGNSVSEICLFRKYRWIRYFKKNGWNVVDIIPNNLFYTGHMLFGSLLTVKSRILMSKIFGSSCFIFVVKKSCAENIATRNTV